MPEGDTIHHAARRVGAALVGPEIGGRTVTVDPERPVRGPESRTFVYDRAGLPCRRCETPIRARGQGDDNRTTFWCPECQG